MKSLIAFLIILFLISLAGVVWGIYEFQTAQGLKTSQTLALIRSYLIDRKPKGPAKKPFIAKKPPENKPEETPEATKPPEKPILEEAPSITPIVEVPVTPTKVELRRTPKPEKPKVKTEAQEAVVDGNKYYDQGIIHLQNTFKKDETFDKENDLAVEKFRQAMVKYLEAEKIDPDSLWLRGRIKDTNGNLITCRRQARRK
ncbi:MAG: hypothetical protein HZA49_04015 [Planctomycetes bacterium]|nr:hypothetical protein [Planctomycetota bacterium]